jgi:hypothetical protein
MTRRSQCHTLGDLDIAGVVGVYAAQRQLAADLGHPVCGEFSGYIGRHGMQLCPLEPRHTGAHHDQPHAQPLAAPRSDA